MQESMWWKGIQIRDNIIACNLLSIIIFGLLDNSDAQIKLI